MSRILIRFNTKHHQDPEGREWRVLVDGEERLARKVYLKAPAETLTEAISTGEIKQHFLAHGSVLWAGDVATVVGVSGE